MYVCGGGGGGKGSSWKIFIVQWDFSSYCEEMGVEIIFIAGINFNCVGRVIR